MKYKKEKVIGNTSPYRSIGSPLIQLFNEYRDEYDLLSKAGRVKWKLITKRTEGIGPLKSEGLIINYYFWLRALFVVESIMYSY